MLSNNIKQAVSDNSQVQQEVMSVLEHAVSEAARVKREAQALIGSYIELLVQEGLEGIDGKDRAFLDLLCPRVTMDNVKSDADDTIKVDDDGDEITGITDGEEDEEDESDLEEDDTDLGGSGGSDSAQKVFLLSLLGYLYSGVPPTKSEVAKFIDRLQELQLYDPPPIQRRTGVKPFPPTDLVRSVVGQLKGEFKRMYKTGTCKLHKLVRLNWRVML